MSIPQHEKKPRELGGDGASVDRHGRPCEGSPRVVEVTQRPDDIQSLCITCAFYRHVRLSCRARRFCALTGERTRPEALGCEFWPGVKFAEAVLP